MNKELEVKISISETWNNPYRNGHYSQIDISISNNTSSNVTILSIFVVCENKSFPITNDIVRRNILEPYSTNESKGNDYIFKMLKQHECLSENFHLLIKHSCGETISNKLNIIEPPICAYQN